MKRLALLLALLTVASLLAACSSTEQPSTPSGTQQPDVQAPSVGSPPTNTPSDPVQPSGSKSGRDSVNLSIQTQLSGLDPHDNNNLQDLLFLHQVYEGLVYRNELSGETEMRVAEKYEISPDGKVYTFTIRDNAYFHNGEPVMAEDVVFSLERAMEMPKMLSYVTGIKEVKAAGDKVVEFHFEQPYAPFLVNLARIWILSKSEVEGQGAEFGTKINLAGTGPYYVTEYDPVTAWKCEAFGQYYRGEAPIKYLNYMVVTQQSSGVIAFESGDLDWYLIPTSNWDMLVSSGKYGNEIMAANHITYVCINWEANDVLANDWVRRAIAYACDKEAMNIAGFEGLGVVAGFMEHPEFNAAAPNTTTVDYTYNEDKIKECLEKAGYPDGVNVGEILCFPGSHFEKCAIVLQSSLTENNMECFLTLIESGVANQRRRMQEYEVSVTGYASTGDWDSYRRQCHSGQAGAFVVNYKGAEGSDHTKFKWEWIDETIDHAATILDEGERRTVYTELNDYLMDTATMIPLLHKVQPFCWDKDLNVINYPNWYFVYDWSWN